MSVLQGASRLLCFARKGKGRMGGSSDEEDKSSRKHKKKDKKRRRSRSPRGREDSRSRSRSRGRDERRRRSTRDEVEGGGSGRKSSRKNRSRSSSGDRGRGSKSNGGEGGGGEEQRSSSSRKKSRFSEAASNMTLLPGPDPVAAAAAAAMAKAKAAELSQRLSGGRLMPSPAPVAPVPSPPTAPPASTAGSLQANALQEQIRKQMEQVQATLLAQQQQQVTAAMEKKPLFKPLRFDAQGREIDEEGNLVKMDLSGIRTVKANIGGAPGGKKGSVFVEDKTTKTEGGAATTLEAAAKAKAAQAKKGGEEGEEDGGRSFMDPRLKIKDRSRRTHRGLAFAEPGTYIKMAEKVRAKEHGAMMAGFASGRNPRAYSHAGVLDLEDQKGEGGASALSLGLSALPLPVDDAIAVQPVIEWWDEVFLPKDQRASLAKDPTCYEKTALENSKTFTYVQHPVPVKGVIVLKEERTHLVMPTYLTKKERKRLRRQSRKEREQEKRDKVALGLMPAPEPKMNLSNFMKVLANESIADPSAVTAKIQSQIKEREKNHEMRNMARKLTPEERREKKRRKIFQDKLKQIEVALFRVRSLSNPKIRYKIDVNAQQWGLTGAVVTCRDPIFGEDGLTLVVVEGGPKFVRRYIKLMLRRIKWDAKEQGTDEGDNMDEEDDDEEDAVGTGVGGEGSAPRCELVWKGVVAKPCFLGFKFQECRTITTARKVLEAKGLEHYFDMIVNTGDGHVYGS